MLYSNQKKKCKKKIFKKNIIYWYRKKDVYPQFEKTLGFKFEKIVSFQDKILTIKTIIYLFLLKKVSSWLGDKIILFVLLNVFIFYSPINKKFPHFLFYIRMYIKQIIEGTIGILICFFPTFEKSKKITKEKTN